MRAKNSYRFRKKCNNILVFSETPCNVGISSNTFLSVAVDLQCRRFDIKTTTIDICGIKKLVQLAKI